MEPLFKNLVVMLAPQLRQMPPAPLNPNDLQLIFQEVRQKYPYQTMAFTPDQRGVVFQNDPEDMVELRPAQIQIQAKFDGPEPLVASTAEEKVMAILKAACNRLDMETFVQCGIKVIALAAVPGNNPDAKEFVSTTLMRDVDQANVLGPGYFGGGIRFRKLRDDQSGEDSIAIEPFVLDNSMIYLDYEKARGAVHEPIRLDQVSTWIEEAFEFVSGPTMTMLTQ
jgi:hypothetical protein